MHGVDESRVKLWIDALRSGEFKQANGYLETVLNPDDPEDQQVKGNCCLGVAQHVALRNGWVPKDVGVDELDWGMASMNPDTAKWFGFRDSDDVESIFHASTDPNLGEFQMPSHHLDGDPYMSNVYCVEANDDLGWDFTRIADALEARYITPPNIEGEQS